MELRYYEMNDDEFINFCESNDYHTSSIIGRNFILLRGYGYKYNVQTAKFIHELGWEDAIIYTNDEELLSMLHFDCFDKKTERFSIYINDVWIHELYENIRISNNILKMYKNGVFGKEEENERKEKRID